MAVCSLEEWWPLEPMCLQSSRAHWVWVSNVSWEDFVLSQTDHVEDCLAAAAAAKSLQSCPTLCDPIDGSPTGSSVPGTLQARTLEWVAISFSNAWKWKVKVKLPSHVWLPVAPWTIAHQAPPSMGFSRQEYWSGFPFPWDRRGSESLPGVDS